MRPFREGSIKEVEYCPSNIQLSKKGDKWVAIFTPQHSSHSIFNLDHIHLSEAAKNFVLNQAFIGVSDHRIILNARKQFKPNTRDYFLSTIDVRNVKSSAALNYICHEDDGTSLLAYINDLSSKQFNCIQLFKPQLTTSSIPGIQKDDFLLVIMTEVQMDILKRQNAIDSILIADATHGTNAYNFQLTTLMALDERRKGYPVAYLISKRVNTANLIAFFESLKKQAGKVEVGTFITDDAPEFHSAWEIVMGKPKHKLLCTWHVCKSWKKNMPKIKDKITRERCYEELTNLQRELNRQLFHSKLAQFLVSFGK